MNPNFGKKKKDDPAIEKQGYVFRLYPNSDQITLIEKTFGCTRFVWNKLLADKRQIWRDYRVDVDPLISEYKKEFAWLAEIDPLH